MTTITALNVRLGMDVSNFSEGANLARAETTRVAAIMRQSVPPAEKFKQELDLLNRAFSESGKKSAEYANAVEFLKQKYNQIPPVLKPTKAELDKVAAAEKKAADNAKFLADIVDKSTPSIVKYEREMIKLSQVWPKNQQGTMAYARAVEYLQKKYEQVTPAIREAGKAQRETVSATTSAVSAIKGLAAAYLGVQTVAKSIKLATEVEDTAVAFEVLTGNANDAKVLFEQVRQFSERSPVTFSGAAQAARTMMSFGVAAADIEKNLQMLSDVTGGNNDRFKMLSLAFSQTAAAGRLMGQDLLQMINAGFNPLQQISKTTGESLLDLKKRMEDGGISSEEVRAAFEAATTEGGMFHGMTERLAETMGGKLNIALSQLEKSLAAAGQAMAPLIISMTDGFEKGQSVLNAVVWTIEKISDGLGFAISLAKDLFNLDFSMEATNKFLDALDKRARERLDAEANQATLRIEQDKQVADKKAEVDKKAIEEAQQAQIKAHLKAVKEWEDAQKKAIEAAQKERLKAIEAAAKAQREAERAFQRELESARDEAMKFFEERAKKQKQLREDASKGPGAGIEFGTAESAKFAADIVNGRIGAAAVPNEEIVRNRDVAKKTAEILVAQREANMLQAQQLELAKRQLAEMQENGFRRIR